MRIKTSEYFFIHAQFTLYSVPVWSLWEGTCLLGKLARYLGKSIPAKSVRTQSGCSGYRLGRRQSGNEWVAWDGPDISDEFSGNQHFICDHSIKVISETPTRMADVYFLVTYHVSEDLPHSFYLFERINRSSKSFPSTDRIHPTIWFLQIDQRWQPTFNPFILIKTK